MLKNILAGITGNQVQAQQPPQSPMMQMPMMGQMMPQQMQFDPYGQQVGGLKAALMGGLFNGLR
jgi:hypothetical protein